MPSYYCTSDSCGLKNEYLGSRPARCSRCNQLFDAPFKAVTATITPAPGATVASVIEDDDAPIMGTRRPRTQANTVTAKPRYRNGQLVPPVKGVMTSTQSDPTPLDGPDLDDDDNGEPEEDDVIDIRAKRKLARELAATLNPDDIYVDDDDEKPMKFADIWNDPDAQRKRESGGGTQPRGRGKGRKR